MAVLLAQSVAWPAARQSNAGHRLATQAVVPAQPHAVRGAPARRLLSGVPVRQRRGGRAAAAEVQKQEPLNVRGSAAAVAIPVPAGPDADAAAAAAAAEVDALFGTSPVEGLWSFSGLAAAGGEAIAF